MAAHTSKSVFRVELLIFTRLQRLIDCFQEFCRVAVMGLLSDFFLQTFFFTTILSMDIGQMELSDVMQKQPSPQRDGRLFQFPVKINF